MAIQQIHDSTWEKYQQNTNQLRKYMEKHLRTFENVREWADLVNWLEKTHGYLQDFPTPYIKESLLLAKRLAQCLNPQ